MHEQQASQLFECIWGQGSGSAFEKNTTFCTCLVILWKKEVELASYLRPNSADLFMSLQTIQRTFPEKFQSTWA